MGTLVYWHKYDEPIKHYDDFLKKEVEITGEWKCDNPLVEKGWFIGYLNPIHPEEGVKEKLMLLLKDGARNEFNIGHADNQQEAIDWLNSIQNLKP